MRETFRAKLERIDTCALDASRNELSRNLLHAYVACLPPREVCDATLQGLSGSAEVLAAVRSRLLRFGREGRALPEIDALGCHLIETRPKGKAAARVESLLSHIYPFLAPTTRQRLLERWHDRGTRGAAARWLKALSGDELLFSIDDVLEYWRQSQDWRAARVLAYRAEPDLLSSILPEVIENCGEGWIVSRAILRASSVDEANWIAVRAKFPATYAYLCVKAARPLTKQDALAIVEESDGTTSERGLAIWAVGQLGLVSTLDRVWEIRDKLKTRDLERLGMAHLIEAYERP